MTKWDYIRKISAKCTTPDGNLLLELMDYFDADNLLELRIDQVREFAIAIGLA